MVSVTPIWGTSIKERTYLLNLRAEAQATRNAERAQSANGSQDLTRIIAGSQLLRRQNRATSQGHRGESANVRRDLNRANQSVELNRVWRCAARFHYRWLRATDPPVASTRQSGGFPPRAPHSFTPRPSFRPSVNTIQSVASRETSLAELKQKRRTGSSGCEVSWITRQDAVLQGVRENGLRIQIISSNFVNIWSPKCHNVLTKLLTSKKFNVRRETLLNSQAAESARKNKTRENPESDKKQILMVPIQFSSFLFSQEQFPLKQRHVKCINMMRHEKREARWECLDDH